MADGLLNKASIILTPTGYKAGTLYNVAPVVEPYEDFDFARASVASRVNSSGLVEMVGRTLGSELVQNGDFSELGSELVTNGDFATDSDWTLGGAATIENDALHLESATNEYSYARQDISSLAAKTYKIQLEIKNYVSGACQVGFTGTSPNFQNLNVTSDGTYTAYVSPNANGNDLEISREYLGGNFNFDVDNVSVKQVDPNDYWTLGTGWSIADGKANVDTASNNRIEQDGIVSDGNTYAITFTILNYNSGSIRLRLGNTYGVYTSGNGTYTQYIQCTTNDKFRIYASSSGANLSIDNVSVKEVIDTNNIPRISYDSNGDNGHILLEPTSTNLLPYSEDFTTWTINPATTVYSNTTETLSPSGEYNASKITSDGSNGLYKAVAFGGGDNTKSIYLKGIVGGEQVILRDPAQTITQKTLTLTTDWVRYDLSENQTSTIGLWINEIPSNGIYMWGAQLEALSYPTSYIPTLTGSTVTRATETANGAGSADLINSTVGVLYAEIAALVDDGTVRAIYISNGTTSNRLWIEFDSSSNRFEARYISGGVTSANFFHTVTNTTDYNKIAFKWKVNDFALWINGVEVATDTSGGVIAANTLNRIDFHNQANSSVQNFYGKVKALAVFNEALSDAELNNLTG